MKKVEVILKTPSGNNFVQRVNANNSTSASKCAESVCKSLPKAWTLVSAKVIGRW